MDRSKISPSKNTSPKHLTWCQSRVESWVVGERGHRGSEATETEAFERSEKAEGETDRYRQELYSQSKKTNKTYHQPTVPSPNNTLNSPGVA